MVEEWKWVAAGNPLTLDQLEEVSRELLRLSRGAKVWLFYGEMGSGKTTLIKAIARVLGVTTSMSSPTFSLVNEYRAGENLIYHFDLYRLNKEEEAFDIGMDEYFDSGAFCFVEWPDRITTLYQTGFFCVRLRPQTETTRKLEYGFYGREA